MNCVHILYKIYVIECLCIEKERGGVIYLLNVFWEEKMTNNSLGTTYLQFQVNITTENSNNKMKIAIFSEDFFKTIRTGGITSVHFRKRKRAGCQD